MSPLWGDVAGIITVVLLIVFIGIWFWAWRARHGQVFDRMARLPMADRQDYLRDDEDDHR